MVRKRVDRLAITFKRIVSENTISMVNNNWHFQFEASPLCISDEGIINLVVRQKLRRYCVHIRYRSI